MNITQLTTDQISSLGNDELADVRDHSADNATIVENRNVINEEEHRTARNLRALHYDAATRWPRGNPSPLVTTTRKTAGSSHFARQDGEGLGQEPKRSLFL